LPLFGPGVEGYARVMIEESFGGGKIALSLHDMLMPQLPTTLEEPWRMSDQPLQQEGQRRSFQPYHSQSVPKPENLEAHAHVRASSGGAATTMMLRNIPNKYTQITLLEEIDAKGFAGLYNFFYLPMDVHNRSNVGYAFINFNAPSSAQSFFKAFSEHHFTRFPSRKVSSVCAAHVQGLDENLRHFENRAVTHAKNDQYRPVVLNGAERVDFLEAVEQAKARLGAGCGKDERAPTTLGQEAVEQAKARLGAGCGKDERAPTTLGQEAVEQAKARLGAGSGKDGRSPTTLGQEAQSRADRNLSSRSTCTSGSFSMRSDDSFPLAESSCPDLETAIMDLMSGCHKDPRPIGLAPHMLRMPPQSMASSLAHALRCAPPPPMRNAALEAYYGEQLRNSLLAAQLHAAALSRAQHLARPAFCDVHPMCRNAALWPGAAHVPPPWASGLLSDRNILYLL